MFWGWYIVHRYEKFSYLLLIKQVYIPTIIITISGVLPPLLIKTNMEQGWCRLIILTITTEVVLLLSTYNIALNKEERHNLIIFIKRKINRNEKIN